MTRSTLPTRPGAIIGYTKRGRPIRVQAGGAPGNPYLKRKREQAEAVRKSIDGLQTRAVEANRDLTEDELRSVTEQVETYKTLVAEIEMLTDDEHRSAAVAELAAKIHDSTGQAGDGQAAEDPLLPYSLLPSREQLTEVRAALSEGREIRFTTARVNGTEHMRAVLNLGDVGGPVMAGHGVMAEPRRLVVAVGLVPETVDSSGASGPRFGPTSGAAPTAEGGAKPEADAVTKLDIVPQALARWTDTSRHALLSNSGYLEQLSRWHAQFVAKDEDRLIITALAAAAGTPIDGSTDNAAGVRTGIAVVSDAASSDADVAVVHPNDYAAVTEFAPTSGSDVGSWAARIGNAVVYPSGSATEGTVLVAALRAGGRFLLAMPPQVAVLENLKDNTTTVRTEEFAGFGVRLVGSVAAVDLIGA